MSQIDTEELNDLLKKYFGSQASNLLKREMAKLDLYDIDKVNWQERVELIKLLCDNLFQQVITTTAKLRLIRSQLISIFGLSLKAYLSIKGGLR